MTGRSSFRLWLLRAAGILLVTLGIVHLIATPHIATLIRHAASPASARWLTPPMLLNHIIVGVLLIPLGYLTIYAAPHAVSGESWGRVVVRTTALSVATLPVALFGVMGTRYYFDAPLFVMGAALTIVVAVTLLLVAFAR
jgi:hypothetical protein